MAATSMRITTGLIRLVLTPFALGEHCLNVYRRLRYRKRYSFGDASAPLAELLADDLLGTTLAVYEIRAQKGGVSIAQISFVGAAASVLGRTSVEARALKLYELIQSREAASRRPTNVGPWCFWLEYMRPFVFERTIEQMRATANCKRSIALCIEGRFRDAHIAAGSGLPLEELVSTLAVLGEFKAARRVARDSLGLGRGLRFVLAVELFRCGRIDEALARLAELEPTLDAWDRVQLALGFGGWEPWPGYPYPDY